LGSVLCYDAGKKIAMLEFTTEERQVVANGHAVRVREDGPEYVLLRADVYDRMAYDDSSWTDEEMDMLAEAAREMLDRYQP